MQNERLAQLGFYAVGEPDISELRFVGAEEMKLDAAADFGISDCFYRFLCLCKKSFSALWNFYIIN